MKGEEEQPICIKKDSKKLQKGAIKLFIQHLIDLTYKSRPSVAIDIDNMLLQRFSTLIWGFGVFGLICYMNRVGID